MNETEPTPPEPVDPSPPEPVDPPLFSVGRLVVSLGVGLGLGGVAAGLVWLIADSEAPLPPDPMMMGATILILVTAAGLWIGATGDNLRRAIRIGMSALVVVGFTADGCGAPLWATILLGIVFAVMGFMRERKKEEVGDFSNFLDD